MKIDRIALIGYLILCFVAIFANFFELYGLKLFSKSMLIPVLFFYYLGNVKKIDFLACGYLFFNFIGDSIGVLEFDNEVQYLIIPFFLCNIILIIILFKKIERLKLSIFNFLSIFITTIFLGYLWWTVVDVFAFSENYLQLKIGIYGVSLFLISFLVGYTVINKINTPNLWLLFCVSCILISDVFYVLYNFQANITILDTLHFSCQIFSYLFFVKYIISSEKLNLISK